MRDYGRPINIWIYVDTGGMPTRTRMTVPKRANVTAGGRDEELFSFVVQCMVP